MKFSVITPCFNGESGIDKCIGSTRAQASPSVEVEHIVQDGVSRDGTVNFLSAFSDRISAQPESGYSFSFKSEADQGMYDAINRGWSRADGEILSWLNHDEQYLPGTLDKVARVFAAEPDVDVVYGNMIVVDGAGNPLAARREIPLRSTYIKHDFLYAISCTIFFRRSLLEEGLLVFDNELKNAGDLDLMLGIVTAGKKIVHIDDYLSLFGVDGENLSVTLKENMDREVQLIQKKFGGHGLLVFRKMLKGARMIEKWLKGCYRKDDLTYAYACNEDPHYETRSAKQVGSRFTYDYVEKMMRQTAD